MSNKIEVDELAWQQNVALAQRFNSVLSDPKRRNKFLAAWQEANPDVVIPEVKAAEPVMEAVNALRTQMEADRKERAEEKAKAEEERRLSDFTRSWDRQKEAIRGKYGDLTDKGIEEIEKLAKERGIPDLEAAAALFREMNPPATVGASQGSGTFWDLRDQPQDNLKEHMEKLFQSGGENAAVENAMINDVLADIRGQKRAA